RKSKSPHCRGLLARPGRPRDQNSVVPPQFAMTVAELHWLGAAARKHVPDPTGAPAPPLYSENRNVPPIALPSSILRSTSARMSEGIWPPVLRLWRAVTFAAGSASAYALSQINCRRTAKGLVGVVAFVSAAAQV